MFQNSKYIVYIVSFCIKVHPRQGRSQGGGGGSGGLDPPTPSSSRVGENFGPF